MEKKKKQKQNKNTVAYRERNILILRTVCVCHFIKIDEISGIWLVDGKRQNMANKKRRNSCRFFFCSASTLSIFFGRHTNKSHNGTVRMKIRQSMVKIVYFNSSIWVHREYISLLFFTFAMHS